MEPGTRHAPAGARENRRAEYPRTLAKKAVPPPIALVIRELVTSGKRADMVALFDGKATWHAIKTWRQGRRGVPQWAIDLVRSKVDRINAALQETKAGPGYQIGAKNLAAWHARNKDKKEKASD